MATALAAQPDSVRAALAGHRLIVGAAGFGVLAVEPTRADAFGPAYRIQIEELAGIHVVASANPAMDRDLGRTRTAMAKAATDAAVKSVKASETGHPDPDGLETGSLRWRRARAAYGWLIAAKGWKLAEPEAPAAAKAVEAARKAARK